MYKCLDCGNTEKFLGHAQEKGGVLIYKNDQDCMTEPYAWIYMISEKSWNFDLSVDRCFFCNSGNIIKI